MLEKSETQNIPACENQGKQSELSYHWKSIKTSNFKIPHKKKIKKMKLQMNKREILL